MGLPGGGIVSLLFLDTDLFAMDFGWRLGFGMGAVLGATIFIVRRHVSESSRWLLIHGKEQEAERIVSEIERSVIEETGRELPEPESTMTVHQRKGIPFHEIAETAFKIYPTRTVLCFSLFIGQAFLYNAVTFDLGTIFSEFYGVASGSVPKFMVVFAVANFLGPLRFGRLFDTVGRRPMIAGTYFGSAVLTAVLAFLFGEGGLTKEWFLVLIVATFFIASAGASSAYLTASEVFPIETRALAIAFFYAIGTSVGGITGPLLFGHLIDSGQPGNVAIGFFVGAVVMAVGGLAALLFGVKAERRQLESVARPLTAVANKEKRVKCFWGLRNK